MNSPVVKKHAKDLARFVMKEAAENAARLDLLWLCILNRPITEEEKRDTEAFLEKDGNRGWTELCHAIRSRLSF